MKDKMVGIFICMLLMVTFIPVTGNIQRISITKEINYIINPLADDKWMKTFGGPKNDFGTSVQQTSDGGYILIGSSNITDQYNILLIKTDIIGNKIWEKTFGGTYNYYGQSVKQTSDNGYILVGFIGSNFIITRNVLLIKTDSEGNKLWDKKFDTLGTGLVFDVIETSTGEFLIAGYTSTNQAGSEQVFLIKTDGDGNKIWDKYFGGDLPDYGYSVIEVNDGGYVVAGSTLTENNSDVLLLKTDANGDFLWDKKIDINAIDDGNSVKQTSDGGFIITGLTIVGNSDEVLLLKTDSNGELLWYKTFGENTFSFGESVQQTYDGGYIIAGFTQNSLLHFWGLLIKTDVNGEKEWSKTYGGKGYGEFRSVQQTTDEGYILTGDFSQSLFKNPDIWLVKTDASGNVPNSHSRNMIKQRMFNLFPDLFRILQIFNLRM